MPLARYEDFQTDIERIAAGEPSVLTADKVLLLQPTSGTTGGEKLIPYTASLRREYQRAASLPGSPICSASVPQCAAVSRLLVDLAGCGHRADHARRDSDRLR